VKENLADYIARYVNLKGGRRFVGLCPFHSEKSPSFYVTPSMGVFKCFGCGEGGDIYAFAMKYQNVGFAEAKRILNKEYGVGGEDELDYMLYLLDEYSKNRPYEYFESRGIIRETCDIFEVGFWRETKPSDMSKLVGVNTNALKGRIIFPIFDKNGMIVSFAGRADVKPKYINGSESHLYKKSNVLYGLNLSTRDTVFVHEGYVDVMATFQNGADAVATCGTGFTPTHAKMLKNKHVVLAFDGDEAGFKATHRAAIRFASSGKDVEYVVLPSGKDPNDVDVTTLKRHSYLDLIHTSYKKWGEVKQQRYHAMLDELSADFLGIKIKTRRYAHEVGDLNLSDYQVSCSDDTYAALVEAMAVTGHPFREDLETAKMVADADNKANKIISSVKEAHIHKLLRENEERIKADPSNEAFWFAQQELIKLLHP
jgi:DNA primase